MNIKDKCILKTKTWEIITYVSDDYENIYDFSISEDKPKWKLKEIWIKWIDEYSMFFINENKEVIKTDWYFITEFSGSYEEELKVWNNKMKYWEVVILYKWEEKEALISQVLNL